MTATSIEWADAVWNPVTGCDRVSPGCAHCYALELAPRLRRFAIARGGGKWAGVRDGGPASGPAFGVTLHPEVLEQPLRWRRPRRVFVNSMSDLFHEDVPDEYIDRVFAIMAWSPQHTYQVLTKRPERMRAYVADAARDERIHDAMCSACCFRPAYGRCSWPGEDCGLLGVDWPLTNVWLGVSIESRRFVGRADVLRATPAATRFISAEPLLGPLVAPAELRTDMLDFPGAWALQRAGVRHKDARCSALQSHNALLCDCGAVEDEAKRWWTMGQLDLTGIDWLIVGGESGSRRRMQLDWARDLRDAAAEAGTAFFMKQVGGARPGASLDDLPDDLRIREFPSPAAAR